MTIRYSFFTIIGVLLLFSGCSSSENSSEDPLSQMIQFSPPAKADFMTGSLSPFSGNISEFSECVNASPVSRQKGNIYALVHTSNFIQMLEKKYNDSTYVQGIKNSLDPILGHAYKNTELHWEWKQHIRQALQKEEKDTQYIFHSTKGEEPFWYCYFTTGPSFFQEFFYPESIVYATYSDDFQITMQEPLQGKSLKGFAPWGSSVHVKTESGQTCETWADNKNEFFCEFANDFAENEMITADIVTPDGTPYQIQKRQGNAKSLDCVLDAGHVGECQVQ